MKYKQCLFFVAKCLTLDQHPERVVEIKEALSRGEFDWKGVLKIGSGQFVLPAMHLQLKRHGLLAYVPDDLLEHLEGITILNRERNSAILEQASEITQLLNENNIAPVFLKGVAHLLTGLYIDIAERMIGDIDFLVEEDKMVETANVLIEKGYKPLVNYNPAMFNEQKHFPRLQNFKYPAAVEIHKELLSPGNQKLIRGFEVLMEKQPVPEWQCKAFIPSSSNMIIHNVLNAQLNDKAFYYCKISLRQMYDLRLLSLKTDSFETANIYGKKFKLFNSYFAAISYVFSNPKEINFRNTCQTKYYTKKLNFLLSYRRVRQIFRTVKYLALRLNKYISILALSIIDNNTRKRLFYRISDRKWYRKHLLSYAKFFKHK